MATTRETPASPELNIVGTVLKDRWKVSRKIGSGGFGQIYEASDNFTGTLAAVKVELSKQPKQVLKMEVAVLMKLEGKEHICKFFGCGRNDKFSYIIMSLQGKSLADLRRCMPATSFSVSTTLRLSRQILEAIETIHTIGFLHRDIKPSNFAMGLPIDKPRQVFMLDYGLARQYIKADGSLRPARAFSGFRGTVRYASINAHLNKDLGRHDDLWSMFYMLIEFITGVLPWRTIKKKEEVGYMKQNVNREELLKNLPSVLRAFYEHILGLTYNIKPDYVMLRELIEGSLLRYEISESDPFDWESYVEDESTGTSISGEDSRRYKETDANMAQTGNTMFSAHPNVDFNENHFGKSCNNKEDFVPINNFSKCKVDENMCNYLEDNNCFDNSKQLGGLTSNLQVINISSNSSVSLATRLGYSTNISNPIPNTAILNTKALKEDILSNPIDITTVTKSMFNHTEVINSNLSDEMEDISTDQFSKISPRYSTTSSAYCSKTEGNIINDFCGINCEYLDTLQLNKVHAPVSQHKNTNNNCSDYNKLSPRFKYRRKTTFT